MRLFGFRKKGPSAAEEAKAKEAAARRQRILERKERVEAEAREKARQEAEEAQTALTIHDKPVKAQLAAQRQALFRIADELHSRELNWAQGDEITNWNRLQLAYDKRVVGIDLCTLKLRTDLVKFRAVFGPVLEVLNLGWNFHLHGDIACLENCKNLKYLSLFSSQVEGDIAVLEGFEKLEVVCLSKTKVSGQVQVLASCPDLKEVYLKDTLVRGESTQLKKPLPRCRVFGPE